MAELATQLGVLSIIIISLFIGILLSASVSWVILKRWRQRADELEAELRSHSFELQVTLDELADKNRQLQQQSERDALSSAYNRGYFDKQLGAELKRSRREQRPLAIVLIDIDHFKQVNDTYGHITGDKVIQRVAGAIQQQLKRPADKLCRYGGEEFALILPNTSLDGAVLLAEQIRQQLANDITEPHITASAGCYAAIAEADSQNDSFIEFADSALYQAKAAGRNQVHYYPSDAVLSVVAHEGEIHEH